MSETQVFQIVLTTIKCNALYSPIILVSLLLLGTFGIVWWTFAGARNATFEVGPAGLTIKGGPYGRTIPLSELDQFGVRVVDLNIEPELSPRWRTNGASLPGLRTGWFKLRNGRKALLFVTDPSKVVFIPGSGDYDVLLSTVDPESLVKSVRELGR